METALGTVDANQGGPTVVTYSDFSSDVSLGQKILIAGYEYEVAGITTSEIQVVGTLSEGCTHATAYKCRIVEIPAVSTANQVKKLVESLPGVGAVDVIRVGPDNFNCFTWRVTFASFLGSIITMILSVFSVDGPLCILVRLRDIHAWSLKISLSVRTSYSQLTVMWPLFQHHRSQCSPLPQISVAVPPL